MRTSTAAIPQACWSDSTRRSTGSSRAAGTPRQAPSTVRRASATTCSARCRQHFEEFTAAAENFDDQGERIVVTGRFKGRAKSGAELDAAFEHVNVMKDGKIVRFENNVDQDAWTAAWS